MIAQRVKSFSVSFSLQSYREECDGQELQQSQIMGKIYFFLQQTSKHTWSLELLKWSYNTFFSSDNRPFNQKINLDNHHDAHRECFLSRQERKILSSYFQSFRKRLPFQKKSVLAKKIQKEVTITYLFRMFCNFRILSIVTEDLYNFI